MLVLLSNYADFGGTAVRSQVLVIILYQFINDKNAYGEAPEPFRRGDMCTFVWVCNEIWFSLLSIRICRGRRRVEDV